MADRTPFPPADVDVRPPVTVLALGAVIRYRGAEEVQEVLGASALADLGVGPAFRREADRLDPPFAAG
jgi:hypothetical protein